MYTLSTCPRFRKTKKFFTERNVPVEFVDYDLADPPTQERNVRELEAAGANGSLFVRIGDRTIEGYHPGRYAELLGL
jgi:arsenate reductase-like glutaredoxin family protein